MLFREDLAEEKDPFSDWPESFYEERNPEKREKLILEKIRRLQGDAPEEQSEKEKREEEQPEEQSENGKQEEEQPEEQSENGKREEEKREEEKRLSVLYERYPSLQDRPLRESKAFQKNPVIVDRYMYSWMNILIAGRTGIHFWNRRAVKKELDKLLDIFVSDGKMEGQTEGGADALSALRQKEIECFALLWLENCVKDKSYGSTVFGMIRMSDESLSRKMAEEIGEVLLFIPAAVGLEEKARPVKEVFLELYFRKINGGEEQWKTVMEERGLNGNGSSDF